MVVVLGRLSGGGCACALSPPLFPFFVRLHFVCNAFFPAFSHKLPRPSFPPVNKIPPREIKREKRGRDTQKKEAIFPLLLQYIPITTAGGAERPLLIFFLVLVHRCKRKGGEGERSRRRCLQGSKEKSRFLLPPPSFSDNLSLDRRRPRRRRWGIGSGGLDQEGGKKGSPFWFVLFSWSREVTPAAAAPRLGRCYTKAGGTIGRRRRNGRGFANVCV